MSGLEIIKFYSRCFRIDLHDWHGRVAVGRQGRQQNNRPETAGLVQGEIHTALRGAGGEELQLVRSVHERGEDRHVRLRGVRGAVGQEPSRADLLQGHAREEEGQIPPDGQHDSHRQAEPHPVPASVRQHHGRVGGIRQRHRLFQLDHQRGELGRPKRSGRVEDHVQTAARTGAAERAVRHHRRSPSPRLDGRVSQVQSAHGMAFVHARRKTLPHQRYRMGRQRHGNDLHRFEKRCTPHQETLRRKPRTIIISYFNTYLFFFNKIYIYTYILSIMNLNYFHSISLLFALA